MAWGSACFYCLSVGRSVQQFSSFSRVQIFSSLGDQISDSGTDPAALKIAGPVPGCPPGLHPREAGRRAISTCRVELCLTELFGTLPLLRSVEPPNPLPWIGRISGSSWCSFCKLGLSSWFSGRRNANQSPLRGAIGQMRTGPVRSGIGQMRSGTNG